MSLRNSRRDRPLSSSQTLTRDTVRSQRSLSSSRVNSHTSTYNRNTASSTLDVSKVTGGGRGDDRITLNVGGMRYQTTKRTLLKVPNSVLSELAENALRTEEAGVNYEYFFDRSPALFPAILDYYRQKELHMEHTVCPRLLQQELEFWKVPESALTDCCWNRYAEFFEKQRRRRMLEQILSAEAPPEPPATETLRVGTHTAEVTEPHGDVKAVLKKAARTVYYWLRYGRAEKLKLFVMSLKAAAREINLFVVLLFLASTVFGLLIRLVESSDVISSLTGGIWWSMVTMTTIGYAGENPQSVLGYVIGTSCVLLGLIMMATILPILGSRYYELSEFNETNKRVRRREKHREVNGVEAKNK